MVSNRIGNDLLLIETKGSHKSRDEQTKIAYLVMALHKPTQRLDRKTRVMGQTHEIVIHEIEF